MKIEVTNSWNMTLWEKPEKKDFELDSVLLYLKQYILYGLRHAH